MLAGAELYLHRFEQAVAHGERALRVGRATGQGQQFPLIYALLGTSWYMRGMLREAAEPLEGAVEAARLTGNAQTLGWSLYARSRMALALGDVNLALTAAQEAVDVTDDGTPSHHHSHAALALADASLETGKPERAIELIETANGGKDLPLAAKSFRSFFLDSLVRARLAAGDVEGAATSAAVARESADEVALPLAGAFADRAAAEVALHTGDAARAAGLALASAATAVDCGAPMEASLSRVVAGRALAAMREVERASEALQAAADDFQMRGAIRHRDRAERELRALGVRIHRRSAAPASANDSGVETLTRRELEIARLIVDRRTNREIAEALFLSPKTVETHVRNIFGKLRADSRVEVARIVERAERLGA
jgi:DNA-binding CsgD family transcriptional regulator